MSSSEYLYEIMYYLESALFTVVLVHQSEISQGARHIVSECVRFKDLLNGYRLPVKPSIDDYVPQVVGQADDYCREICLGPVMLAPSPEEDSVDSSSAQAHSVVPFTAFEDESTANNSSTCAMEDVVDYGGDIVDTPDTSLCKDQENTQPAPSTSEQSETCEPNLEQITTEILEEGEVDVNMERYWTDPTNIFCQERFIPLLKLIQKHDMKLVSELTTEDGYASFFPSLNWLFQAIAEFDVLYTPLICSSWNKRT
jgi:hypothetical protein